MRADGRDGGEEREAKCSACMWGAKMAVVLIPDHWNASRKSYRVEAFCYGPKSCAFYRAGPRRKAPGRRGTSRVEEDWVDVNEARWDMGEGE
jgi:hypothetical protein